MNGAYGILILVLITVLYFLPSICAYRKSFASQVIILNFLLGWTLIGWVVALVWAFKEEKPQQVIYSREPEYRERETNDDESEKPTLAEEILNLKELHNQGILTDEEFEKAKEKVLNK